MLKSVAEALNLSAYGDIIVEGPIKPSDVHVDFIELHFKDQFVTRGRKRTSKDSHNHLFFTVSLTNVTNVTST